MADPVTEFFSTLMNGKTGGIPNIMIIAFIGLIIVAVYLFATRKPKLKEFKPRDMRKEQRDRYKREYGWFGKPLGQFLYEPKNDKPSAFVIGISKSPEKKKMQRTEPYGFKFSKEQILQKSQEIAKNVFQKEYNQLSPEEKKQVYISTKEELEREKISSQPMDENVKYDKGRKITTYYEWIPHYLLRVCKPSFMARLVARLIGMGTEIWPFDADQLEFVEADDGEKPRVNIKYDVQKRIFNGGFVFSESGKDKSVDIGFAVEREEILEADANALPRMFAHSETAGVPLLLKREDAAIDEKKNRRRSETHDM